MAMASSAENRIRQLLELADVGVDGNREWDLKIHNPGFYRRVLSEGSIGLGESYMDGWWDCKKLDVFFYRILRADLENSVTKSIGLFWDYLKSRLINLQKPSRAFQVGEQHYDTGNDLYEAMLDSRMVYTCGYWRDGDTLDEAQLNKLETVCSYLGPRPEERILDIGCGWGSFARYAAEEYGVEVVGITVSKEQQELARKRVKGWPVEIRFQDYREVDEKFDYIISLGMFEHVGNQNYRTYMDVVHRCLNENGIFVLHTIGGNTSVRRTDPWIDKYIFPNSLIPSIRQIGLSAENLFVMEHWSNHGTDYDKTLMAWYRNFDGAWETLKNNYTERFRRIWTYYLLSSAGSFRARKNNQWQIVFTRQDYNGNLNLP